MLKASIYNYKSYIFNLLKIMGVIALSIAIFSVLFRLSIYMPFKSDISSYNSFVEELTEYFSHMDLSYMLDSSFLSDTSLDIYDIFKVYNKDFSSGTILIILSIGILIGGYLLSQYLCRRDIRSEIRNKDTVKPIRQLIFMIILHSIFWIVFFLITFLWKLPIVLLPLVLVFLNSVKILIASWYVYFQKYLITNTINIPNIFKLLFTNALVMYSHYIFFLILVPYINLYLLLFIAISFHAYLSTIAKYTATQYLIEQRSKRQLKKI
ncbi:MAG: hypothetical protein R3Y05_02425 [bacterium]